MSSTFPLSPFWTDWRQARTKQLRVEGMPLLVAITLAENEAETRARASRLVGQEAALSAKIMTEYRPDGTFGTYIVIDPDNVPPHLLPATRAWANATPSPKCH